MVALIVVRMVIRYEILPLLQLEDERLIKFLQLFQRVTFHEIITSIIFEIKEQRRMMMLVSYSFAFLS